MNQPPEKRPAESGPAKKPELPKIQIAFLEIGNTIIPVGYELSPGETCALLSDVHGKELLRVTYEDLLRSIEDDRPRPMCRMEGSDV